MAPITVSYEEETVIKMRLNSGEVFALCEVLRAYLDGDGCYGPLEEEKGFLRSLLSVLESSNA